MGGVGDVAGDRDDVPVRAELARRDLERFEPAGVDHEAAAAADERAGEGEAEAAGGSGDDGGGHDRHARRGLVALSSGNWS